MAVILPVLVLLGFLVGWFIGGALDRIPRMLLSFTGGMVGLIIGSLIIYVMVKRIVLAKAKSR